MSGVDLPMLLALMFVSKAYAGAVHWINSLDRQGWFLVLCCAVVAGYFCLRGFGSRSNY
ncbi:MAG TPA: hypothetical protein VHX65_06370 [Pirellulales bacterium]|nr:hypothetical protein [Pirellulales bacterium]